MKFKLSTGFSQQLEDIEFNTLEELAEWMKAFPTDWKLFRTSYPSIIITYDEDDDEFDITIYNNYME